MLKAVLDLLIPQRCFGCGRLSEGSVCPGCLSIIGFVKNHCLFCGKPTTDVVDRCRDCSKTNFKFDKARCLFEFKGVAENIIKGLKYEGGRFIPREIIYRYQGSIEKDLIECDLMTFIPSAVSKFIKRGYNPAEEIARSLVPVSNKKVISTLIYSHPVSDQTKLNKNERKRNLRDAFKVIKEVKGKNILLVDDVFTTGTTVNQAAVALKKAGAKKVNVFTLARRL